jgi:hypothetical protein
VATNTNKQHSPSPSTTVMSFHFPSTPSAYKYHPKFPSPHFFFPSSINNLLPPSLHKSYSLNTIPSRPFTSVKNPYTLTLIFFSHILHHQTLSIDTLPQHLH